MGWGINIRTRAVGLGDVDLEGQAESSVLLEHNVKTFKKIKNPVELF